MSPGESAPKGKKVLLYGGSFDPPTQAHLIVPEWVMGEIGASETWFILANQNPMKERQARASAELRYEMLTRAIKPFPDFRVETLELERGGPSYTVETLRALTSLHPFVSFALLLGEDALDGFPKWRDPDEIMSLAEVVTVQRPGWSAGNLPPEIDRRVRKIDMPSLELSSTLVRERIAKQKSWRSLVPEAVAELILEKGLYSDLR